MKRSELKPGKPLKAGKPLKRKKAKKKPKSKLARRIDKMDSSYWNRKCKEAVAAFMHTQPCLICGAREPKEDLICGHHLLRKSRSKLYRWHPMNIIPLCDVHHLSGIHLAAHSDNPLAVALFVKTLEQVAPEHYRWLREHAAAIRKTDMRGPIEHPDWRYQHTIWQQRVRDAKIIRQEKP